MPASRSNETDEQKGKGSAREAPSRPTALTRPCQMRIRPTAGLPSATFPPLPHLHQLTHLSFPVFKYREDIVRGIDVLDRAARCRGRSRHRDFGGKERLRNGSSDNLRLEGLAPTLAQSLTRWEQEELNS